MPFIHDSVLDGGLTVIDTAATDLHITSAEATTRANALTNSLGSKVGTTINAPSDRGGGGRECVCAAISDGTVDATGTADSWAIIDGTNLLAAGQLASSQPVTSGNTFSLGAFGCVQFPDAT